MEEIKKSVLGSVRLDSDVWEAVRAMECSLNVYLRETLLLGAIPFEGAQKRVGRASHVPEMLETKPRTQPHPFKAPLLKPSERKK